MVGPAAVGMGKPPVAPENALARRPAAKCSNCCGSCWSRYSVPLICILQMQMLI
jgi:hypothetical protein